MKPEAAIGVFDSGVGGISVLHEIRRQLPRESLMYVADNRYVPYGEKSPEVIQARSERIAEFLIGYGVKALVVACNTATAAAVPHLRARYPDFPILGMEPAVKPAAQATRSGIIGVLATTGTLKSARFAALLDRFAAQVQVITQPCPGLVECVEKGELEGERTVRLLESYLVPLLEQGCDTLILGCTHYPFLKPLIRRMVPAEVSLIDTGAAVAQHLQTVLEHADLLAQQVSRGVDFWCTQQPLRMSNVVSRLWGSSAEVHLCPHNISI